MKISSHLENSTGRHVITVRTNDNVHGITIPPKSTGLGSSANGGEVLFLALATCYCNDIYREAVKRSLKVLNVEVDVEGDFGAEGEPATNVTYRARVTAQASEEEIRELRNHTDQVAEIQNTLRECLKTRSIVSLRAVLWRSNLLVSERNWVFRNWFARQRYSLAIVQLVFRQLLRVATPVTLAGIDVVTV